MSAEPMSVAIGFHPYYQLTDSPRDEWRIAVGAWTHWLLAPNKVPTGETEPIERLLPNLQSAALGDHDLDEVFGDLVRNREGRATMSVVGRSQRLDTLLGPNFRSVVIYSPNSSWRKSLRRKMGSGAFFRTLKTPGKRLPTHFPRLSPRTAGSPMRLSPRAAKDRDFIWTIGSIRGLPTLTAGRRVPSSTSPTVKRWRRSSAAWWAAGPTPPSSAVVFPATPPDIT